MSEEKVNYLSLLFIENEKSLQINFDDFFDEFSNLQQKNVKRNCNLLINKEPVDLHIFFCK